MKRKLMKLWKAVRLMRTAKHEAEMERQRNAVSGKSHQIAGLLQELEHVKSGMDRVLPHLVNIRHGLTHSNGRYRVQVEMDLMSMAPAFQWGNDDRMLRCIADRIGMMLYRELKTTNLHRFEDEVFQQNSRPGGMRYPKIEYPAGCGPDDLPS